MREMRFNRIEMGVGQHQQGMGAVEGNSKGTRDVGPTAGKW